MCYKELTLAMMAIVMGMVITVTVSSGAYYQNHYASQKCRPHRVPFLVFLLIFINDAVILLFIKYIVMIIDLSIIVFMLYYDIFL